MAGFNCFDQSFLHHEVDKAIAMDMNATYASAVKLFLPGIDVVYDRFHVMGLLNKTLEEIRRLQQNKCKEVGLKCHCGERA